MVTGMIRFKCRPDQFALLTLQCRSCQCAVHFSGRGGQADSLFGAPAGVGPGHASRKTLRQLDAVMIFSLKARARG